MDKERILGLAKNVFSEMVPVSESVDLYRGELKISGKQAGVYYMDLSGKVSLDTFNEYQEKVLADEYYNHPGNIQWNIYLLLLQETVNPEAKERIERNDKYARKYVFTESQFEDFFRLEKSNAAVSSNVVLQWKEALNKVNLQEVYSKAKYTDAVGRFIDNQAKNSSSDEGTSQVPDSTKIRFINQLILKNTYREYPKEPRVFRFGKVNLIKGINGVGKTCLLESIELIACGRTKRNPDKREPDNCIEALVNNSRQTENCTPSDNAKYRLRDAYWYSNNYPRDNYLYTSFNRFNYFDTDAANDFAKSNNEDQVKVALSNIILGTEFNYLSERINGFYDRIKPIYNELEGLINNAKKTISDTNLTISKIPKSETLNSLIDFITSNIRDLRLKYKHFNLEESTGDLEGLINQVKVLVDKLLTSENPFLASREELYAAKKELSKKESSFNEFKENFEKVSKSIYTNEQIINTTRDSISLLESSLKYFNEPKLFEIKDFSKRMSDVDAFLGKVHIINNGLVGIDIQAYSSEENLDTVLRRIQVEFEAFKSGLSKTESELNSFLAQFDNIDKILNEIKLLGKEYLDLSPEANSCPLCQTIYERPELQKRIEEVLQNNSKSNQLKLDVLHQKQRSQKDKVDKLTKYLADLSAIKSVYSNAFRNDSDDMSINHIIKEILRCRDAENSYVQRKQDLTSFLQFAEVMKVTEGGFSFLNDRLTSEIGPEFILSFDNKNLFEDRLATYSRQNSMYKQELELLIEKKFNLIVSIKKVFGLEEDRTYTLNEINGLLAIEKRNINSLENLFTEIGNIIDLDDNYSISELDFKVSILQKNLLSFKSEQQHQYERGVAEKNRREAQIFLNDNTKKFERIRDGFEVLQSLRLSDATQQLNSFFESNLKEVIDIFKTIHAPREFKSVVFQDKQLYLIKENNRKYMVNEISTGQRAALALSIFITLNRQLKNGPNIMIFDDPVSHIDDLNALAFLDFLRFFILKEDRQIFFATANARLASLFEKKFDFMEEEFQKWELIR